MGHELGSVVDDVFLRMVEDLDVWNDFLWGEHMWRELYGAIRNVNLNYLQRHHKALEMNPNFVPTYSLCGFLLSFKIWILESSCVTDRWWCKRSEEIPRGCSWSKHFPFQNWRIMGNFFPRSTDFFKMYTPRASPVEYEGLFGAYLKTLSLACTRREKDGDAESGCQTSTKEVSLKDHVKAMEGLCTSLMILPKEIKSLKARVYKLETNYWSAKDGEFFSFNVSPNQSANKDPFSELIDPLDDLVDENGVVEVEKDLSEDDGLKVQKIEAENKRLAEQRRIRFHKMKEQENDMKSSYFSNSTHMKLALEKYGTNKRKYVDVLRPPDLTRPFNCIEKVYCNFVLEQFLITSVWRHCKFPWCNDNSVDGRFWDALIGLDDKRLGWLLDVVKDKQEKDKIRTKSDKNRKREKAQQCQSPITVRKAEKRRKYKLKRPKMETLMLYNYSRNITRTAIAIYPKKHSRGQECQDVKDVRHKDG
nr:hypothetical protein [Tanacetum cinerariifolium]